MNKRERVMAAIRGEPVDRVPVAFWLHNFAQEHSPAALADETMRLYELFDWDFVKPQSRATCFAEVFGTTIARSAFRAVPFEITKYACANAHEFARLQPVDATKGALGEQLEAFADLRRRLGPDVPIVGTIFAPMMTAAFLIEGGREGAYKMMREAPEALERGLAAVAKTLADFGRESLRAGADGIFFATNVALKPFMTLAECRRFQRPFDLPIMEAIRGAPFNIMHICGEDTHFDEFLDYPAPVLSWATTPGNPTLTEVLARTGRAVLGGLPGKPQFGETPAAELVEIARASIAETGGRHFLLGPGCSINPGTPDESMRAIGKLVGSNVK